MMNTDWRVFLLDRGARWGEDGRIYPPPLPAASRDRGDCTRHDLSHLGLIAVQGSEAGRFLQGQLTNDIHRVTEHLSQLTGYCSPKGRLLALCRAIRSAETLYLQLPLELVADTLKRLNIYVLRSKVTLTDHSDGPVRIGLAGADAPRQLECLGLPVPGQVNAQTAADGVTVLRLPSPVPRFQLIAAGERQRRLWDALTPVSNWGDQDAWALHDLQAGIPNVYPATVDTFVPQMVNLDLIDGVSFTKGCYTGQEVVARLQHLSRPKRRMYLAEVASPIPPGPGDMLESPTSASEQGAGRVVDARPLGASHYALLAVVEIAAAEGGGEVRLGASRALLRLCPPPYGFPADRTDVQTQTTPHRSR